MSGPKYYDFQMKNAEEAAAILAQLSTFRPGVKVEVVNNQLKFTVSNEAWCGGVNRGSIQQRIDEAKKRYAESEKQRIIFEAKRDEEIVNIDKKAKVLEKALDRELARIDDAISIYKKMKASVPLHEKTAFGEYGLQGEVELLDREIGKAEERRQKTRDEYNRTKTICDQCLERARNATSLDLLARIQREYTALFVVKSSIDNDAKAICDGVKAKIDALHRFVDFLDSLDRKIKTEGFSDYFDRIKQKVAELDAFDEKASEKVSTVLNEIKEEIGAMRKIEEMRKAQDSLDKDIAARIEALDALTSTISSVVEITESMMIETDYPRQADELIGECEQGMEMIGEMAFLSAPNAGALKRCRAELDVFSCSFDGEAKVEALRDLLDRIKALVVKSTSDLDLYTRFMAEKDRYRDLITRLQGVLSGSKEADGSALRHPEEFFFSESDPEGEIDRLRSLNDELEVELRKYFQESVCSAFGTVIGHESWGEVFNRENYTSDESAHLTYVRKDCRGVIFDVECAASGKVGVYPRGVKLHNGISMISSEGLDDVYNSCGWAEDMGNALHACGLDEIPYHEAPSCVREAMKDQANYYQLETREESIEYLKMNGYTPAEIERLIGKEESGSGNKRSRDVVISRQRSRYAQAEKAIDPNDNK